MARRRRAAGGGRRHEERGSTIMTRRTNAGLAGYAFLAYIAAGITSMVLFHRVAGGDAIAAKLAGIAQHPNEVGVIMLLHMVECFSALTLAVTLHAITRDQDRDLALLAGVFRVVEGVNGGLSVPELSSLRWLATRNGPDAPDPSALHALGAYLFHGDLAYGATFFAFVSLIFAWLLLRGRMIPGVIAWIGVIASALLVVGLPLQLGGFLQGPITQVMWLPMLAFEVPVAVWFIVKGVAAPARVLDSVA